MAILEVHHGRGRVDRVIITRDHPSLFGSSSRCDIVIDGEGVAPFHGRVRWKSAGYFKVDASKEGISVELNGQKVRSAPYRRGDELRVGTCRIFMIQEGDAPREAAGASSVAGLRGESADAESREVLPRSGSRRRRSRDEIGALPPEDEVEELDLGAGWEPSAGGAASTARARLRGAFHSVQNALTGRDRAPGEERILNSPLVLGLVGALVVLVFMSVSLWGYISRSIATRLYDRAVESLDNGDNRNAIRQFDEFLATEPAETDKRRSKARVLRALANVRQFTSSAGASWSNALDASREMVDSVGDEEAYRDINLELAELVLKAGEAIADRAKVAAEAPLVAEAESAVALHARVAGKAAGPLLARSRLPAKLDEARAAVLKRQTREKALAAMDAALKAGSSSGVYEARDALVAQYPELSKDRDLIARMTSANDLIRRAVASDPSRRPAETTPHPEPLGPATSLVVRSGPAAPAPSEAPASGLGVVTAIADGSVFGLDGASGAPLWQVPVGLSSSFPPVAVPGEVPSALVFDSRHDELLRLDRRTGALVWRQSVGGPVADAPLVLGNTLLQATKRGALLLLDLASGELRGTLDLKLPLARTPVVDESGGHLYVLAAADCLFVINRESFECVAVEYLGHAEGSIPCAPARIGRFLVLPENHTPTTGRWRIFVLDEDGARLRPAQEVEVAGWTWATPPASGTVIWSVSDRGAVAAYGIGTYESKEPFRLIASTPAEPDPSGPAFGTVRNEREIWVASGRPGRLDLNPERGTLKSVWTLGEVGPALAPLQPSGSSLVWTQQDGGGPGVTVVAADPQTGAVRWRTVLGSPWTSEPTIDASGEGLDALGLDGKPLALPRKTLASGGFVEAALPGPGLFRLPTGPLPRLVSGGVTVVVPSPTSGHLLVREGAGDFRRLELPAPLGAPPVFWGDDLFLPGGDGRAYRIDPRSGESRAEPLVPDYDREAQTAWLPPALLEGDALLLADESGKVRRLTRPTDPRPRLVVSHEVEVGKPLKGALASTGAAVVLTTADGQVRALASGDLSPLGTWTLGEAPVASLGSAGRLAFVGDARGKVLAIGPDGGRLWSIELDGEAVGAPGVVGDSAYFLTRAGILHRRKLDDGSEVDRRPLGILPAGAPRALGPDLMIPVALGTVRLFIPGPGGTSSP